jgi:hypothetical protein
MRVANKLMTALACSGLLLGAATAVAEARTPAADPLSVYVLCEPYSSTCEAYSEGGAGGNSFSWTGATLIVSGAEYSAARVSCTYRRGHTIYVSVTVTDASNATATGNGSYYCNW